MTSGSAGMSGTETTPDIGELEIFYFSSWDEVAIISGTVVFLICFIFCLLCVFCPGCCLNSLFYRNDVKDESKEKESGSQRSQISNSSKGGYGSTGSDYGQPGDVDPSTKGNHLPIIRELDHGYSDWAADTGSALEVIRLENAKNKKNKEHNGEVNGVHDDIPPTPVVNGELQFSLTYLLTEEKLLIVVTEVGNITLSEGAVLVSPYVKVRLYRSPKQFFTFRSGSTRDHVLNNLDREFKTKMKRPSDCLTFKESFEVPLPPDSLKHYTVRLLLCDMDKLSRHVVFGEISVALKKLDLTSTGELMIQEKLQPPLEETLGKLYIGLSYLPTSEKLYLTVESMKGFNVMDRKTGSTDACVKAFLMYDGKQLKRVKTTVRAMNLDPVFNESFSFDVPQTELGKVYLSLVVCHYSMKKKSSKVIGRVYLGLNFDPLSHDHWINMMENPRKKIISAYDICN